MAVTTVVLIDGILQEKMGKRPAKIEINLSLWQMHILIDCLDGSLDGARAREREREGEIERSLQAV